MRKGGRYLYILHISLSSKFHTVALQRNMSSASVHRKGDIETAGTFISILTIEGEGVRLGCYIEREVISVGKALVSCISASLTVISVSSISDF